MTDLELALALAAEAAIAINGIYAHDFAVETKADGSPVTLADRTADALIRAGLARHRPGDAVLTEESTFTAGVGSRLWLVDPLDGTADFADRTGDFAVMIGLCVDGEPVLGVVAAPALDRTFAGVVGEGAFELVAGERRPLHIAPAHQPPRVLVSRKHPPRGDLAALFEALGGATHLPRGSVGVKCGLLAAGEADLYLHPTRGTWLWDCAAPQAIIEAAGGRFTRPDGSRIPYDLNELQNPAGVLVAGPALHTEVCTRLAARTEFTAV